MKYLTGIQCSTDQIGSIDFLMSCLSPNTYIWLTNTGYGIIQFILSLSIDDDDFVMITMDDAGTSAEAATTDADKTTGDSNLVNTNFREDDVCIVCSSLN